MSQEGREQGSEPRAPGFSSAGTTHREVVGCPEQSLASGHWICFQKGLILSLPCLMSFHHTWQKIYVFWSKTLYKRFSKYSIHLFKALLCCLLWWVSGEIIRYLLSPFHLAKAVPPAPMCAEVTAGLKPCYCHLCFWNQSTYMKKTICGNSLVVHWLGLCTLTAKGPSLIPGHRTKAPQASQHKPHTNTHTHTHTNTNCNTHTLYEEIWNILKNTFP